MLLLSLFFSSPKTKLTTYYNLGPSLRPHCTPTFIVVCGFVVDMSAGRSRSRSPLPRLPPEVVRGRKLNTDLLGMAAKSLKLQAAYINLWRDTAFSFASRKIEIELTASISLQSGCLPTDFASNRLCVVERGGATEWL